MNKEEFFTYVQAIIDMEFETAKQVNPIVNVPTSSPYKTQYELTGALKLINEALNKVDEKTRHIS